MRNRRLAISLLAALFISAMLFPACKNGNDDAGQIFYIYYRDSAKRELLPVEATLDETLSIDRRISSVWRHLSDSSEYTSPVPASVSLKNYAYEDNNLTFNFSASYASLSAMEEVILRASLVKTFAQFPEVSTVEIRVEDQPFATSDGRYIGPQQPGDFADLFGTGLNSYVETETVLYFSDEPGECLIPVKTSIVYSNAVPLEQAIIERLIMGPEEPYYRTLPANLKLLSVSVRNSVCYVNLNGELLKNVVVSKPAVSIYSIVNSLSEVNGIGSVQISVNGSSNLTFMEEVDLSEPLIRTSEYNAPPEEPSSETEE